jgi:hypothetical protein
VEDLDVSCEYLGVKVGDSEPDVDKPAFSEDVLVFKWALRTENWEWVDSVSTFCKHLHRGVPLPRCTVTKQRLIDVATASAQKHSKDKSFDVVCRYEGALEAGGGGENVKLKDRVSVRDLAKFHWEVVWLRGRQVAASLVRAYSALKNERSVPLPDGWATALQALRAQKDARVISNADLLFGIAVPECFLVGLPKPVEPADVGAAVGARVLLVENGRPLHFVLLANIRAGQWSCHSGCDVFSQATPWSWERHAVKDIVADAWAGTPDFPRPTRRQRKTRAAPLDLTQQMRDHPREFDLLVAEAAWAAELERALHEKREPDFDLMSFNFDDDPFKWKTEGHAGRADVWFAWSWYRNDAVRFRKQSVRLDNALAAKVPLPPDVLSDSALCKRLEEAAKAESKNSCCPCKYLGRKTDNGHEPDPSKWEVEGRKWVETVWIEYLYVRHADTNKPLRAQIHATHWASRCRCAANPLNVKAARRLRFSIDFMNAFAANKKATLTFKGVCYDNSERPEIVCQLPNQEDIQHERFYWEDTSTGGCVCLSLLELRDAKEDLTVPEGSQEALHAIADQFGYDVLGFPSTKEDEALFDEYRQGSLGSKKERRWEDGIVFQKPAKESERCWFLTNAGVADQGQEPKFVCRSVATLRVQLREMRIATTAKIRTEHETRSQRNAEAVAVLDANWKMWRHVGGVDLDFLQEPNEEALARAHEAKDTLIKLKESHADAADNTGAIADELIKAVNTLSSLDFEAIRRDKFPLTPETIFDSLVQHMNHSKQKLRAEQKRREDWLKSPSAGADEDGEVSVPAAGAHGDIFGCDPDAFARPQNNFRPHGWKEAVLNAGLVHIDELAPVLPLSAFCVV